MRDTPFFYCSDRHAASATCMDGVSAPFEASLYRPRIAVISEEMVDFDDSPKTNSPIGNMPTEQKVDFALPLNIASMARRKRSASLGAPALQQRELVALQRLSLKNKPRKSVSWADDHGGVLVSVIEEEVALEEEKNILNHDPFSLLNCSNQEGSCDTSTSAAPPEEDDVFSDLATDETKTEPSQPRWSLAFRPPGGNFYVFKKLLESQKICLETAVVDVRDDAPSAAHLCGTVKVSNMCFEKRVFVRLSRNDWVTFEDHPCQFSGNGGSDAEDDQQEKENTRSNALLIKSESVYRHVNYLAYLPRRRQKESLEMASLRNNYDTFRFDIQLTSSSNRKSCSLDDDHSATSPMDTTGGAGSPASPGVVDAVQFCIGYRAGAGLEFWDSNQGSNYRVLLVDSPQPTPRPPTPMKSRKSGAGAAGAKVDLRGQGAAEKRHFFGDDFTELLFNGAKSNARAKSANGSALAASLNLLRSS